MVGNHGSTFYLHTKYLHSSALPVEITENRAFHTNFDMFKNCPALNGKPWHIGLTKLTLLTSYCSGYYPLISTNNSINIITKTKFNHQQRELQETGVGFVRTELGRQLRFLLESNALLHVHCFILWKARSGGSRSSTQ